MIRKIMEKDARNLCIIFRECLGHEADENRIALNIGKLKDNDNYFIAVFADEKDNATGVIQAEKYDLLYSEGAWNIMALAVLPEFQNKGYGKALVEHLIQHARKENSSFIRLNSRSERKDAHAFYEHLGFICDKTQKRFILNLR